MIIAEKLRSESEKLAVLQIINEVCRVQLDPRMIYLYDLNNSDATLFTTHNYISQLYELQN